VNVVDERAVRFNKSPRKERASSNGPAREAPAPVLDFRSWIVFEDDWLLAVDKPAGVLSQGGEGGEGINLVDLAREYLGVASGIGVLHRIDRNVSGLVLLAKDSKTASTMTRAFAAAKVERVYEAISLVRIAPSQERFVVDAWLRKDARNNLVEASDARSLESRSLHARAEFREARTDLRIVERITAPMGALARCDARPITGRSHQIRVHLAWVGLPIVGDPKYGALSRSVSRPLLHATALRFRHPRTQQPVEILRAPPWDDALLHSLS
jgi:23S rRNA pseudouridine1911/1915/1917 synthase